MAIVGAGLSGAVACQKLTEAGYGVELWEKSRHIGGNCRSENHGGIHIHQHGAHIFHTQSDKVWEYVNRFAEWEPYTHHVKTRYRGRLYTLPFCLDTARELYGSQAEERLETALAYATSDDETAEEYCMGRFGIGAYRALFEGYCQKQWGVHPRDMPADAVKRLPVQAANDLSSYFKDKYQAIPKDGYTDFIAKLIGGAPIHTTSELSHHDVDDLVDRGYHVVWTGMLDALHSFRLGKLGWRALEHETRTFDVYDVQGMAVVNYADPNVPYTRSYEWKHFQPSGPAYGKRRTYVTYETPRAWSPSDVPTHPVVTDDSRELVKQYKALTAERWGGNVTLMGRLATHTYIDMDQAVNAALVATDSLLKRLER